MTETIGLGAAFAIGMVALGALITAVNDPVSGITSTANTTATAVGNASTDINTTLGGL